MAKLKSSVDNSFYVGEQYMRISEIADRIGEYKTFKERYHELTSDKTTPVDEWDEFLRKYYTRVLCDGIKINLNKIKSRKTFGQSFSKIKNEFGDHLKQLETKSLSLVEINKMLSELKKLQDEVNENIQIEGFNRKQFWKGIIIGAVFGLIGGFLLYMWGFA